MERRRFLKNFGLAGAAFSLPPAVIAETISNEPAGYKQKEITVSGRVHNKGKGIAGVQVTDGTAIVLTDKDGRYQLMTGPNADFIYISVPSGYAFNNNKGIAQFYSVPEGNKDNHTIDFSLEQLNSPDKKHCFVVWADTQMISQKDVELLQTQSVPDLQKLLAGYPEGTLFHGIGCGDLVWDKFELYDGYKKAIESTGVTFFNVIGNHDMDLDARTDELSAKTFKKHFGPTYYSFNRGEIHYITLDDVFFIGVDKKYIGYINETQLQWLEKDLSYVKPGTTIVLSLHIPTNTGAARRAKKEEELGSVVSNRKQLYKLLQPYKVHIMSGHTHFNDTWEDGNIMEHNHGTVCWAWWTGPICGDGTPGGYGVYEVDGSEIKWYYKSTGLPKTKQINLFGKGQHKNYPDEIMANVWNWDNKWKVEWSEDGVNKGPMEQRTALDPLAVELYAGPDLPKKHKFVEPMLADHMFFAKPSQGAKLVEVTVTDRFGNIYSEKTSL